MSGLLDDCELADIQAELETLLDTAITAERPSSARTRDGYGHYKANGTPTQVADCMAMFARPSGPVLTQIAGKVGALVVWVMSVPLGTNLASGDVVTVTATGTRYTVQTPLSPESYSPWLNVVVALME